MSYIHLIFCLIYSIHANDVINERGEGSVNTQAPPLPTTPTPLSLPPLLFVHPRFSFSLLPVMAFRGGFQEVFFMYMG